MRRGTKCSVQSHNSNDVYLRQRKVLIMRLWLHQHGTSQSQFTKKNKDSNPILHREKNVVQLNLRHSKESMRPRYLKLLFSGKRMGNLRRNCTHPLISRTASDSPRLLFGPLLLPPRSFSCCAEQLPIRRLAGPQSLLLLLRRARGDWRPCRRFRQGTEGAGRTGDGVPPTTERSPAAAPVGALPSVGPPILI